MMYLSRGAWGARADIPRLGNLVSSGRRTHVIIHHTVIVDSDATPNLWETVDEVKLKMRQLQTTRPDLGLDVPYNFVIFLMVDGEIVVCEGRGYDRDGAHTYGHNTDGIGIALEGNFDLRVDVIPYQPAINSFLADLRGVFANLATIDKHQDFSQTGCPGKSIIDVFSGFAFIEPQEEEIMTPPLRFVQAGTGLVWVTDGIGKVGIGHQNVRTDIVNLGLAEDRTFPVSQEFVDSLVDVHKAGNGGITEAECVDAVKQAFKEGSG